MGATLSAGLDLNPYLEKVINSPYGIFIFTALLFLVLVVSLVLFLAKSGILSAIREHQEYKARRIKDEITDQEELLKDDNFKKYRTQIQYNLDVTKLNKLLKYSHHDKDLLEYILSCKDNNLAIMYYESGKGYLEKDEITKKFKLKSYCKDWWINSLNKLGTLIYFGISLGSLTPTIYFAYALLRAGESLKNISFSFLISQFLLFVVCVILALMILTPMVRPWKAKQFLQLEKIEESPTNVNE